MEERKTMKKERVQLIRILSNDLRFYLMSIIAGLSIIIVKSSLFYGLVYFITLVTFMLYTTKKIKGIIGSDNG